MEGDSGRPLFDLKCCIYDKNTAGLPGIKTQRCPSSLCQSTYVSLPVKSRLLVCIGLWFLAVPVSAQGVFVCVQPNGTREYSNNGDTRGCRRLDMDAISTIPAPPANQQAKTAAIDPSFPRIDSEIQKRCDQDRLQILMEEVRTEESRLSELRREYQNGEPERLGSERNYAKYQERVAKMKDDILRTEKNIEALKREIGNLK